MSFRARITGLVAVIVVVAVAVTALAALQATRSQVYGELDRALAQVARVAGDAPGRGQGQQGGPPENRLGAGLPTLLRISDAVVVQVHAAEGGVRVLSGQAAVETPSDVLGEARAGTPVSFDATVDGVPYRGLARPVLADSVLVVAADASEQRRVLGALVVRFWVIGMVVAALAAVAGWFAAGRLVTPLRRLTSAAEHVSATGDLAVDVRTEQPDEAGRLSRAFDEMLSALGSSQAAQQRLVDDAGHELRTPITSILSNAEVLKRHPDLDPQTREQIADDVIAESQELTRLVNALVDLAGVSGEAEEPRPVGVADLVHGAARRLPQPARERVHVVGDADAVLRADQVQRAVTNLLANAVKFAPGDSAVDVHIARSHDWLEIAVRDRGPGIAEADLPHVFARFYRADSARSVAGSGLGLAIVRDVAHRNGGGVAAENHPEGGALVRLTLPALVERPPDGPRT